MSFLRITSASLCFFLFVAERAWSQQTNDSSHVSPYSLESPGSIALPVSKDVQKELDKMRALHDASPERFRSRPWELIYRRDNSWGPRLNEEGKFELADQLYGASAWAFVAPSWHNGLTFGIATSLAGIGIVAQVPGAEQYGLDAFALVSLSASSYFFAFVPADRVQEDYVRAAAFNLFHRELHKRKASVVETSKEWKDLSRQTLEAEAGCVNAARSLKLFAATSVVGALAAGDRVMQRSPKYELLRQKYIVDPLKKALGY
jgi:hypothetical protein